MDGEHWMSLATWMMTSKVSQQPEIELLNYWAGTGLAVKHDGEWFVHKLLTRSKTGLQKRRSLIRSIFKGSLVVKAGDKKFRLTLTELA